MIVSLDAMRKGAGIVLVGVFLLAFGAADVGAAKRIQLLSPGGGQYYAAKKTEGNTAQVRVRFLCPSYEMKSGARIGFRDYVAEFTRREDQRFFTKPAQREADGRCFVQHRFPPGNWYWRVTVPSDASQSETSNFFVESAVPVGPYTLTRGMANRYMRKGLYWKFGGNWQYGFRRQTNCDRRVSRDRFRCSPITWYNGDLTFRGSGRVWFTYTKEFAYWNVAFRVRKTNGYCLARGGSMAACSRVVVFR